MSKKADPVAAKSSFLCMYMSNHPDTLVAYVRHFGKINDGVESATMTSIDSNGMSLSYKPKGTAAMKDVRIKFDPPLAGYEEVKPRLLGMTADAQEALGMTKSPRITGFVFPSMVPHIAAPIALLVYITVAPMLVGPLYGPGQRLNDFFGTRFLQGVWVFLVAAHACEATYMASLLKKHQVDFVSATKYFLGTLAVGFPFIKGLRTRIQKARIDSIMKSN